MRKFTLPMAAFGRSCGAAAMAVVAALATLVSPAAAHADEGFLFVQSFAGAPPRVVVVDTATDSVVHTTQLPPVPYGYITSTLNLGKTVYVSLRGYVFAIDAQTRQLVRTYVRKDGSENAFDTMLPTADGKRLLLMDWYIKGVWALNLATGDFLQFAAMGKDVKSMAMHPITGDLFVGTWGGEIAVYDGSTGAHKFSVQSPVNGLTSLFFANDKTLIAHGYGVAKYLATDTVQLLAHSVDGDAGWGYDAMVSSDGTRILQPGWVKTRARQLSDLAVIPLSQQVIDANYYYGAAATANDGSYVMSSGDLGNCCGSLGRGVLKIGNQSDFSFRSTITLSATDYISVRGFPFVAKFAVSKDADGDGVLDASDNCASVPNADQANADADNEGDACDLDDDNDGVVDKLDNCPFVKNPDQADLDGNGKGSACDNEDADGDGVPTAFDNCGEVPNADQSDTDGDSAGDACDGDDDGDAIGDDADNCPTVQNNQTNSDSDSLGDACDADDDGDGVDDGLDNCPLTANPAQTNSDSDAPGDACDDDDDGDWVTDGDDNCPLAWNLDQMDIDFDSVGDSCDPDDDNDGVADATDSCPTVVNAGVDNDWDSLDDACDPDDDNDGAADGSDNCPLVKNDQADFDTDGQGDACDADVDGDGVGNAADQCGGTGAGAVVEGSTGCSLAQLCPCSGPKGQSIGWKNHGQFVSCVAKSAQTFVGQGLLTVTQKDVVVSAAAGSTCGK